MSNAKPKPIAWHGKLYLRDKSAYTLKQLRRIKHKTNKLRKKVYLNT